MYSVNGTKIYEKIALESAVMSASSNELLTMLFDGALSALVRARLYQQEGNIARKGECLSKAINIIDNGLRFGLDENSEDPLTRDLIWSYNYMVRRILQSNLHNDIGILQEVEGMLREITDAWKQVSANSKRAQDTV